jgi:hypothetical protein
MTCGVLLGRRLGVKVLLKVGKKQEEKPVNPDTKVLIKATGEVGYVVKEDGDFYYLRIPQTDWPFPVYAYVNKKGVKRAKINKQPTDIEEAPF